MKVVGEYLTTRSCVRHSDIARDCDARRRVEIQSAIMKRVRQDSNLMSHRAEFRGRPTPRRPR